ncbi:MAG: hypothetical protein R2822_25700 [Spirosomataceae bacterium]
MTITKTTFGTLPDGQTADYFTLHNKNGMGKNHELWRHHHAP